MDADRAGKVVPKLRPSASAHSRLAQQPAKLWLLRAPIVVPVGPPFIGDADQTAKLNDVDPQARLADILARVADKSDHTRHAAAADPADGGAGDPQAHLQPVRRGALCERWVENPYFQYLCGEEFFRHAPPFDF